jgi:hypothetical protein
MGQQPSFQLKTMPSVGNSARAARNLDATTNRNQSQRRSECLSAGLEDARASQQNAAEAGR